MTRRIAGWWLILMLAVAAIPAARADHRQAHFRPQGPAAIRFAADFPALIDHEWTIALGGFGGIRQSPPRAHVPVIFVHGNNTDHGDWYPVRDAFRAAGWSDQELWGLSLNGLGSNYSHALLTPNLEAFNERTAMGWDGASRVTANDVNIEDLYDFVKAVRTYTGSSRFSLVGHSLGVTVARKMLKDHQDLRSDLVAFVGIAGGNHGTSFCPPGSESTLHSCDEIAADTDWLTDLNGPYGSDETYGPAQWMTVRDGTGVADPAFLGPYADSPMLLGADNRAYPGLYHNDLRLDSRVVADYRAFLEGAES